MPEYLDTRGVVYLGLRRQDAIDDLEKAVAADPSPAKLFHLAQAYLGAKNKEKAKQNWKSIGQDRSEGAGTERSTSPRTGGLSEGAHRAGSALTGKPASGPNAGERSWSFLPDHGFKVATIVIGNFVGKLLDLLRRDKPHAIGDFLKAGDLESLA